MKTLFLILLACMAMKGMLATEKHCGTPRSEWHECDVPDNWDEELDGRWEDERPAYCGNTTCIWPYWWDDQIHKPWIECAPPSCRKTLREAHCVSPAPADWDEARDGEWADRCEKYKGLRTIPIQSTFVFPGLMAGINVGGIEQKTTYCFASCSKVESLSATILTLQEEMGQLKEQLNQLDRLALKSNPTPRPSYASKHCVRDNDNGVLTCY